MRLSILCLVVAMVVAPGAGLADPASEAPPEKGRITRSMSFPSAWAPYAGAFVDWNRYPTDAVGGVVALGINRSITDPVIDLFGIAAEGYVGALDSEDVDAGGRLWASLNPFGLRLGADYSSRSERVDFILTGLFHVRRRGVFGYGSRFRVDWLPWRDHSFNFGFEILIGQPWQGVTRPKHDHVNLPRRIKQPDQPYEAPADLRHTLDDLRHAADWINRYTTLFTDQKDGSHQDQVTAFAAYADQVAEHLSQTSDVYPDGHTFPAEVEVYHDRFEQAFQLALAEGTNSPAQLAQAPLIAAKAKQTLFREIIVPYNGLFGQRKAHDSLWGYGSHASITFADWARASAAVPQQAIVPLMYVFNSIVDIWDEGRKQSRNTWGDTRFMWMPLRWVYRSDEIDSQAEMDAVIEAVTRQNFTSGNDVAWVKNELFQGVLGHMILDAEDYHVLWIHDYRGYNDDGNPDAVAYMQTTRSYLSALINRVQRYDTVGKMPMYLIFLDEWYYAANKSRLWLELLEDPLDRKIKLPKGYEKWEAMITAQQDSLRTAVTNSKRLQVGLEMYGKKWLKNLVKVNINITNPADYSFRSNHILSLPFIPDMLMRDHRKISFTDVTELDPSKGSGIYTGMGVGEHYTGRTWDDRGALARGPALVGLKTAARELLLSQGFDPDQIPSPLRPLPFPDDYDEQIEALMDDGWNARAMQVMNNTGFAEKRATVTKTLIYDLMPPGSHLYIPDSLWNNSLWGGMMIGAALRGCTVLVVTPSMQNAPSAAVPTMARAHRVMARLYVAQQKLGKDIQNAGGALHIGIYNTDIDVGDLAGQVTALQANFERYEFLEEEFPLPIASLSPAAIDSFFQSVGLDLDHLPGGLAGQKPKLHLKSQLFIAVPRDAWRDLMSKTSGQYPHYMADRARQVGDPLSVDPWAVSVRANEGSPLIQEWFEVLPPNQQSGIALYLTEGSQNQDYRSMVEDGEALYVVSGGGSLIALYDFLYIMGISTWIENPEQLDQMLPTQSGFGRWLGGLLKEAI